jgi:hypothetical protein
VAEQGRVLPRGKEAETEVKGLVKQKAGVDVRRRITTAA